MYRGFFSKLSVFLLGVGSSFPGVGNVAGSVSKPIEIAMRTIIVDAPPPFNQVELRIDVGNSHLRNLQLKVDGRSISIPKGKLKGICDVTEPEFSLVPIVPSHQELHILMEYGHPYLFDLGQINLDGPKKELVPLHTMLGIVVNRNLKAEVTKYTPAEDGSGKPMDVSRCEAADDAKSDMRSMLDYGKQSTK